MAKKKDGEKKKGDAGGEKKPRPGGDHVYKKIDLVGSSREGLEDAIRQAVRRASETVRNLDWFEVKEIRGWIDGGEVQHFQVVLQVGFRLD